MFTSVFSFGFLSCSAVCVCLCVCMSVCVSADTELDYESCSYISGFTPENLQCLCSHYVQFLLHLQRPPPGGASAAGDSGCDCVHRNNETERGLTGLLRDEFSLCRLDMMSMVTFELNMSLTCCIKTISRNHIDPCGGFCSALQSHLDHEISERVLTSVLCFDYQETKLKAFSRNLQRTSEEDSPIIPIFKLVKLSHMVRSVALLERLITLSSPPADGGISHLF